MDGNGRWAKQQGKERSYGHQYGVESVRKITEAAAKVGIDYLTLYTFSTENWKRPPEEVGAIMKLLGEYLIKAFDYKNRNNKIVFLGDRTALDPRYQRQMDEIEAGTAHRTGMVLNIAVNYGGRQEIVRAARDLARQAAAGALDPETIDEAMLAGRMYTAGQRDPDLILRPSGEKRLSNFMLWQAAYAELVEMDVLWPDFTPADLDAAIQEYNRRSRRFGGI